MKNNFDIIKLIGRYVQLAILGPGYTGVCPFCMTNEKNTFFIQPRSNTYFCTKCHAEGGIFRFLIEKNHYSIEEAMDEVKLVYDIDFDAPLIDEGWKKIFKDTDYDTICKENSSGTQISLTPTDVSTGVQMSYSSLLTYIQCPYRYKKRYIEHIKDGKPLLFTSLGLSLHSTLSRFYRGVLIGEYSVSSVDSLCTILQQNWISRGYADKEEEQTWLSRAKQMLVNYLDSDLSKVIPSEIERTFKAELGRIILFGKIDRIDRLNDGSYEIIDYKVGGFESLEEHQAQELQTAVYYLGANHGLGLKVSKISYYYLILSKKITIEKLPEIDFHKYIESIVTMLTQDKEFHPRRNLFCQNCTFEGTCSVSVENRSK